MKEKVLRATAFHLVGTDGSLRASLSINPDNTPNLRFFDSEMGTRLDLSLRSDGTPLINVNMKKGSCRVALGLKESGNPFIQFLDKAQKPISEFEVVQTNGDVKFARRKRKRHSS